MFFTEENKTSVQLTDYEDSVGTNGQFLSTEVRNVIIAIGVAVVAAFTIFFVIIRRFRTSKKTTEKVIEGTRAQTVCYNNKQQTTGLIHSETDKPSSESGANDSTAGIVPVDKEGGLYYLRESDIHVSVPGDNISAVGEITVITSPVTDVIKTLDIDLEQVVSSVITLLPHNADFDKHILICFPLKTENYKFDESNIQLMYSCPTNSNNDDDDPVWINLQRECDPDITSYNKKHPNEMVWMLSNGYCYLWASHFCHVFLTQYCSAVEQPALFLQVSVYGLYQPEDDKLVIRVGFHCSKCNPKLLSSKREWGVLLGSTYKCLYGKEGVVTVKPNVDINTWNGPINEKDVEIEDLLNLCNFDDIYPPVTFKYKYTSGGSLQNQILQYRVQMTQGKRKPFYIEGDEPLNKLLHCRNVLASSLLSDSRGGRSPPVEHSDSSLEPIESEDTSLLAHDNGVPAVSGEHHNPVDTMPIDNCDRPSNYERNNDNIAFKNKSQGQRIKADPGLPNKFNKQNMNTQTQDSTLLNNENMNADEVLNNEETVNTDDNDNAEVVPFINDLSRNNVPHFTYDYGLIDMLGEQTVCIMEPTAITLLTEHTRSGAISGSLSNVPVSNFKRISDWGFPCYIREEQRKLTKCFEQEKQSDILQNLCGAVSYYIENKDLRGDMVLQALVVQATKKHKSWESYHFCLLCMGLDKIADQLKAAYEKNKLVLCLSDIKRCVNLKSVVEQLLNKGVVSQSDINIMITMDDEGGKWLDYLVTNILCPDTDGQKLRKFCDILRDIDQYKHLVEKIELRYGTNYPSE